MITLRESFTIKPNFTMLWGNFFTVVLAIIYPQGSSIDASIIAIPANCIHHHWS
jgi:hypothetical protein